MVDKISLSTSARTNLLSLQGTAKMIATTQNRLATGKAVSSATDDAVKYFQARALTSRASDLGERKDAIDQGVSSLDTALKATEGVEKLLTQIKGKFDASRSQSKAERGETQKQIGELIKQVQQLVDDASYKGLNLLNSTGSTLTVRFSEKAASKIDVKGNDFNSGKLYQNSQGTAALAISSGAGAAANVKLLVGAASSVAGLSAINVSVAADVASYNKMMDAAVMKLEKTITNVRAKAATMATNSDILKVRLDFTEEYTNVLQAGADKLTLADLNSEGANLLALQTRQQLGVQALSLAGQSEQAVLSLLR
jgi:flagellin-like hook-associated protein FlgL